jgi:hypothetical protein
MTPTHNHRKRPDPGGGEAPPTGKQLAYLRSLAQRAGQSFAYPNTREQASAEIARLNNARPISRIERSIERRQIADAIAAGPDDASRVTQGEIAGFGSSATWKRRPLTTPTVTETVRNGNRVGERRELARYTIPSGERILYGHRINGVVRITDVPAGGRGRAYLVERELEKDGYGAVKALIADYLAQVQALGDVPMAVSPVERYLNALSDVR